MEEDNSLDIKKCTKDDIDKLAILNKELIEDEKSDNPMSIEELKERMCGFLNGDYYAYFFMKENNVVGYALVNHSSNPLYLRQFFIDRMYRKQHIGAKAFELLLEELRTDCIDLEVLSRNEVGMNFWESCGFVERSRYWIFYLWKNIKDGTL